MWRGGGYIYIYIYIYTILYIYIHTCIFIFARKRFVGMKMEFMRLVFSLEASEIVDAEGKTKGARIRHIPVLTQIAPCTRSHPCEISSTPQHYSHQKCIATLRFGTLSLQFMCVRSRPSHSLLCTPLLLQQHRPQHTWIDRRW